jgi:outer membrane protein assembly factor BamB
LARRRALVSWFADVDVARGNPKGTTYADATASLVVVLACGAAFGAGDQNPAADRDPLAVRKLIEQLASDDFATREKATQELSKLEEVPGPLREAAKSDDLEMARRARRAIDVITARAEDRAFNALVQWAVIKDFRWNGPYKRFALQNAPNDPLVVQDKVIVGTDQGQLRAYRCKDGSSVWIHQHGVRIYHRPCSDGERIYFSSEKGLTAVKIDDGTEVWRFSNASCSDGPTLALAEEGKVFVGGNDGNLYALDAKTGKQVWVSDFVADAPPEPPGFAGKGALMLGKTKARPTDLASDGKTLFLSVFEQCRIVAIRATDGKQQWSFQSNGWVYGSAAATEKHVFFGSQDGVFYCLDKQSGKKVWTHKTKGRIESGGVVDDEFVYFGSCDGVVYCLKQSDGQARWRFATDPRSAIYSVPLLRQGGVYFAAGKGQAYALDQRTGELKWKVRPSKDSELFCSPATDEAAFFVVTRPSGKGVGEPSLVAIRLK